MIDRLARDVAHEVVVNVLAAVALAGMAFVLLGGRIEDVFIRLRGDADVTGDVKVLAIDEETLYLWDPANSAPETTPRALLATLVGFLHAAGARTVAVDILLDQPAEGDAVVAEAFAAHGGIVVAEKFLSGEPFLPGTVPVIAEHASSGFANLGQEERTLLSDELRVRSALLVIGAGRASLSGPWPNNLLGSVQADHTVVPSFALAAAWRHLHREGDLSALLASGCGGAPVRCTLSATSLGLPVVPGALHDALPINFRGSSIDIVSASRALRLLGASAVAASLGMTLPPVIPQDIREQFADKLVVIGRTDSGTDDHFVTPYAWPAMQHADMPGCVVQAQVIDTLLSGRHIRGPGPVVAWGFAVVLAIAAIARPRVLFLALVLPVPAFVAFRELDGWIFDPGPAIGLVSAVLVGVFLMVRAAPGGSE